MLENNRYLETHQHIKVEDCRMTRGWSVSSLDKHNANDGAN